MNLIEMISTVSGLKDSKSWVAEKDTFVAELKKFHTENEAAMNGLKESHTAELTKLQAGHGDEVKNLQSTIEALKADVEKLKAEKATVDEAADKKAKQIIVAETGIDLERLPKLATPTNSKSDVLTCLNALSGPERTKYFLAHRDEILRANNSKKQ